MPQNKVEFYLVKDVAGLEIGCEIHANGSKFFIQFAQEEYKGVRIGMYPVEHWQGLTKVPALLVGE